MPTTTGKPGWKTSTFWVKIFTVDAPVIYMGFKGLLPAETAAKIEIIALGLYGVYRAVSETTTKLQNVQLANGVSGGDTATANVTVKAS